MSYRFYSKEKACLSHFQEIPTGKTSKFSLYIHCIHLNITGEAEPLLGKGGS